MKKQKKVMQCVNCKALITIEELDIPSEWKVPRYCPYCGERDLIKRSNVTMLSSALGVVESIDDF